MREEIIIQGHVVGYIVEEESRAFLEKEAPSSILEDLLDAGYAVCIA